MKNYYFNPKEDAKNVSFSKIFVYVPNGFSEIFSPVIPEYNYSKNCF